MPSRRKSCEIDSETTRNRNRNSELIPLRLNIRINSKIIMFRFAIFSARGAYDLISGQVVYGLDMTCVLVNLTSTHEYPWSGRLFMMNVP